jgi:HlyD family secretion protein
MTNKKVMSKLITDPEEIRLREESEVQALLGHPPAWITRWGISLVAIGVAGLFLIGTFLRYPDIVEAPAVIETESPPIRLEAKVDGRIQELMVASGDHVVEGDLLLVLQNPVSKDDVNRLAAFLEKLRPAIEEKNIATLEVPHDLHLADLQISYAQLISRLEAQVYRLSQDDVQRRIASYREQIKQLIALDEVYQKEVATLEEEVTIARDKRDNYEKLTVRDAASELEFKEAQTNYLRIRRQRETQERNLIQNRLEEQRLRSQIIELSQAESDEIKTGWIDLAQALRQLQGELDRWEDRYLLKAPIAGTVMLSRFFSENLSVNAGEPILTIDPGKGEQEIVVRAEIPLTRSGKVAVGNKVFLRLEAYPYKEFGVVEASIAEINSIPEPALFQDGPVYFAKIKLTEAGLQTTDLDAPPIEFAQEMRATARIITKDRSFLGRVMDEVLSLFRVS